MAGDIKISVPDLRNLHLNTKGVSMIKACMYTHVYNMRQNKGTIIEI